MGSSVDVESFIVKDVENDVDLREMMVREREITGRRRPFGPEGE